MFSPSAIADFLACQHLTALNRAAQAGEIEKPYFPDPTLELLRRLGLAHEQNYLRQLEDERGLGVVTIHDQSNWSEGAKQTIEAMRAGAQAIYQPSFLTTDWYGRADFLLRVETSSELGDWSYEVIEAKLAKSTKARALIQLCFYSELVAEIQRKVPERMHVVLGRGAEPEVFSVPRYIAYFRKIKREFQNSIAANPATYAEPVEHCGVCDWYPVCDEQWHADDHLSLVANITRNRRKALVQREVKSLAQLATLPLPVTPKIERIAPAPLLRIREQARVQMRGREEGKPIYELLDPQENSPTEDGDAALKGLAALPLPSPGDVFLDFEGDPFAFEQGLEYLIGMVTIGTDGSPRYESLWSTDPKTEKERFIEFIELMKRIRERYPDMHIYHYSHYEPTAIKRLSGRHGVCTAEVDELLRAEVLVDLFRVVRQGLRASVESYSIKKMEPFYGFTRTVPLRDATSSLQAFETVLALGENPEDAREILKTIADYNRDDCLSTWRLRDWLEKLRRELETKLGREIPRPELKSGAPGEELEVQLSEIALLKERLVAGLSEEECEWSDNQRARWLLAQLLEWHRREEKSMWWDYYRLCALSDEELIEDKNALGGLAYIGVVDETKRSYIHRYRFPFQDHAIDRALDVHDPRTQDSAGTLVEIDELNLTIDLKRGKNSEKPHPTALIPHDYVSSRKQVESLMRIGSWVAEKGIHHGDTEARRKEELKVAAVGEEPEEREIESDKLKTREDENDKLKKFVGQYQAALDALLRRQPRVRDVSIAAVTKEFSPVETAKKLVLSLESSILPIQGPPGSGKTYTGAQMILELVKEKKRVGITAGSHKVISNLLSAVCKAAGRSNETLVIVQKANDLDGYDHDFVTQTDDNAEVLEKLRSGEAQIGAGTAWLWSREEFAGAVDVLFVDEAGQMSLANVLAISPAAKSVVLLGDPQQLDQPQKGVHPPGAEVSALAHLLNGQATIDSHQGLFLAESWRLHPDICAFTSEVFYDGRLKARPENARQRLNAAGLLDGTGLRFIPVTHSGNQSDSPEEVEAIAKLIEGLQGERVTWTDNRGETQPLTLNDILIVAPYNAQVALLKKRIAGSRVGTVDKFQGQQAPVVFYSMTTSTPEEAPRGMEFLYSSNRLNVATSRAQCVTVLVASPVLFDVQCKTPRQMELANAFCRYLEMARWI